LPTVLTCWLWGGRRRDFLPLEVVPLFANDVRQFLGPFLYFDGHRSLHPLEPHLLYDYDHEQSGDRHERKKRADPHAELSRGFLITHGDLSII
jgi:hypothetical protein